MNDLLISAIGSRSERYVFCSPPPSQEINEDVLDLEKGCDCSRCSLVGVEGGKG